MNLTLIQDVGVDAEPITVDDARGYLYLDGHESDYTVRGLITAARLEAENENGRQLAQKKWRLVLDQFPTFAYSREISPAYAPPYETLMYFFRVSPSFIALLDPLVSVESVSYKKADGTTVTMVANTDYIVDIEKHPGVICPAAGKEWPSAELWPSSAVKIEFTAGFTPATCPQTIKQGMQLLVIQWFENRIPYEAIRFVAELPYSVASLFRNNKLYKF